MSIGSEESQEPIEPALEWFERLADLPEPAQREQLRSIEDSAVRACVEELLAGDRDVDARLDRCMVAVAAMHEAADLATHPRYSYSPLPQAGGECRDQPVDGSASLQKW